MKLNKMALALALAGMAAAPIAQSDVTLKGGVTFNISGDDSDGSELAIGGDGSNVTVVAEHEMDNGLTAYSNLQIDAVDSEDSDADPDDVYLGVKGGFGDLRLGEVANAVEYGQVADIVNDVVGGTNLGIGYTGTFGAATVGLTFSPEGNSDTVQGGVKFDVGGFGVGLGFGTAGSDSLMSAKASFGLGGYSAAVGFIDKDNDETSISANVEGKFGSADVGLTYQVNDGGATDGDSVIRFAAGYGLGGDMKISTRIDAISAGDNSSSSDITKYRVQFSKSF